MDKKEIAQKRVIELLDGIINATKENEPGNLKKSTTNGVTTYDVNVGTNLDITILKDKDGYKLASKDADTLIDMDQEFTSEELKIDTFMDIMSYAASQTVDSAKWKVCHDLIADHLVSKMDTSAPTAKIMLHSIKTLRTLHDNKFEDAQALVNAINSIVV